MIKGKNLIIYEGSPAVAIAACKSCSIVNKADVEEKSSPASGQARTYKVTRLSWQVSTNTLVLAMGSNMLRKGQTYFLTLKDANNSADIISGSAICTSAQIVATKGSLAQGNFQFIGLDDINPSAPAPEPISGADFNADYNNDYNVG